MAARSIASPMVGRSNIVSFDELLFATYDMITQNCCPYPLLRRDCPIFFATTCVSLCRLANFVPSRSECLAPFDSSFAFI